ncbi:MAG: glycosyltransferase family 4 protein [Oscillospiraceae bacterium]
MESKKILILSNHFITLYNFRRELIARLISHGHKVYISMPEDERNGYFAQLGCEIIVTPMSRRGMNPAQDISLLHRYKRIMREVQPDIIFSYTIKPNIYGTMASNALHYKQVCNVTGTGATFLHENLLAKLVRVLYRHSMKYAYKVFFQNSGDRDYFIRHHMVRDNWDMLPGSGVNLEQHAFSPMPEGGTVGFIYIGRVMAVKGVEQFMDCARAIRREHPETRFYMAGFIEEERYKALVDEYVRDGSIEYLGFRKDIDEWIKKCCCTVLPSLGGEGVPNVLLESAASGRACIATRIPGSIDTIDDGVTGYIYTPGSTEELISASRVSSRSHPMSAPRWGARPEPRWRKNLTARSLSRNISGRSNNEQISPCPCCCACRRTEDGLCKALSSKVLSWPCPLHDLPAQ